ncbi:flagellar export protein FliJ [Desulfatitalea alkaliphila]|uniref:Flagellar FliJ protein n=1 Tax=Desulfatitalea alkaliphila TaxID=2929485 RepID=A0AA41R9T2_9BACT|nr:flagellar export protein FliJ [Desulfatitalea alkaliphila]
MDFVFKLEALRRYRVFLEEQSQKEFAVARQMIEQEQGVLADLVARRDQTELEFRQQESGGGSAGMVAMYRGYMQRLAQRIEAQRDRVAQAQDACEKQRQALMERMQQRKTLDQLKEKGAQDFVARRNREEEKFINEMAINRFSMKQQ